MDGRASALPYLLCRRKRMKAVVIIGSVALLMFAALAHEIGSYCSDINPYAPEDYPRGDIGQDD